MPFFFLFFFAVTSSISNSLKCSLNKQSLTRVLQNKSGCHLMIKTSKIKFNNRQVVHLVTSQLKSSSESSTLKSRSSLQSFIFQSNQVAYHQNSDPSQLNSKSQRLVCTSVVFNNWKSVIHIHGGRCSHKGMMGTFLKIFGPYKPLLFQYGANLQEEKKKRAQEIKFTHINFFFF